MPEASLLTLPKSTVFVLGVVAPPAASAMFKMQVLGLIWPVISTRAESLVAWAWADSASKEPQATAKAVLLRENDFFIVRSFENWVE
jgi:hypothetical protein